MTTAVDQRSQTRYRCAVPVEAKKGCEFDGVKTLDISRQGIGLLCSQNIGNKKRIAIEVVLKPNTEPVMVIADVKWVRKVPNSDKYRLGMEFSEILSGSSSRLEDYLSSKLEK